MFSSEQRIFFLSLHSSWSTVIIQLVFMLSLGIINNIHVKVKQNKNECVCGH